MNSSSLVRMVPRTPVPKTLVPSTESTSFEFAGLARPSGVCVLTPAYDWTDSVSRKYVPSRMKVEITPAMPGMRPGSLGLLVDRRGRVPTPVDEDHQQHAERERAE